MNKKTIIRPISKVISIVIYLFLLVAIGYLVKKPDCSYPVVHTSTIALFLYIEGNVRVKHQEENSFKPATYDTSLNKGDSIKTISSTRAIIEGKDHTKYIIKPNSILVLNEGSKQDEQCIIDIKEGRVDITTPDQTDKHIINTLEAKIVVDKATDVNIDNINSKTIVVVKEGLVKLFYGKGKEQIVTREQVAEISKEPIILRNLPSPPNLTKPENKEVLLPYKIDKEVEFTWEPIVDAQSYNLLISTVSSFSKQTIKLDVKDIKETKYKWLNPSMGQVFWKVQAVTKNGIETNWSKPYSFRIVNESAPIRIEITKVRQIDEFLSEIEGHTSPKAILKVNSFIVETDQEGNFRKDIILPKNRLCVFEVFDRNGNAARLLHKF